MNSSWSGVVDAHLHLWDLERASYDWIDDRIAPVDRTVRFEEIEPSLRRCGVDAVVLVQAADTAADTRVMLDIAARHPAVAGVVAHLPLDAPDAVEAGLAALSGTVVVGVRALIHTYADPHWLLRPDVAESLELIARSGLAFDLVTALPEHLALLPRLSERHPSLRIVLDHLGKPPLPVGAGDRWWRDLAAGAANPLVAAKISGLYGSAADPAGWTPAMLAPVVDHALDLFGPRRLMIGSDWPMSVLAGGYDRVWEALVGALGALSAADRDRVRGGTAVEWYRLDRRGR